MNYIYVNYLFSRKKVTWFTFVSFFSFTELCGCVSSTCEFEEKIYHMNHIYNLRGFLELWLRNARFTFVIFVAFVNSMNVSSWISSPGNVVLEKCFVTKFTFCHLCCLREWYECVSSNFCGPSFNNKMGGRGTTYIQ